MFKQFLYHVMPWLKVLLFIVFFYLCGIPFGLIDQLGLIPDQSLPPLGFDIISECSACLMVLGALLMMFRIFKQYNFPEIFIVRKQIGSAFAKGAAIGLILLLVCSLIAYLTGNVSFAMGKITVLILVGYLVFYLLVAIFEEFVFRSFALLAFAERYPNWLAILLTSILFGLAHIGNSGFNWLAMVNISLAGALFAILVLIYKNIYWAVGIHFGWNVTQGLLMGYKVSGTDSAGILSATPKGAVLLSGGNFGIESSLICTVLLILIIGFLLVKYKMETVEELVYEEEFEERDELEKGEETI
jgi:membrane protease YdiL (CAAX protease family)